MAGTLNIQHEIAFDARGHLYIAERDNHVIRTVSRETGALSTLAGTGVTGALVEITQVQAVKMVELFSHGAMTGIRGSANGSIDRRLPCSHSRNKILALTHNRPDMWTLAHASKTARQAVAGMVVGAKNGCVRITAAGACAAPFSSRF